MSDSTDKTIRPNTGGNSNNGSTIRPNTGSSGNNGSTIRPNTGSSGNNGSTIRPNTGSSGNNGSTIRPNTGSSGNDGFTIRPSGTNMHKDAGAMTIRQDKGQQRGFIKGGIDVAGSVGQADQKAVADVTSTHEAFYKLNGITYKVKRVLSDATGEAMVLLVENGGNDYVLKLYFQNIHPDHKILDEVKSVRKMGLFVETLEHGVWSRADNVKNPTNADREVKRDYELMRNYPYGSMDQLDLRGNEQLLSEYVVQMAAAIDLCHHKGFLHRDIKPGNFLFADRSWKRVLLSDFGIAVPLNSQGVANTNQARTKVYAAPESYFTTDGGNVRFDKKCDYFSLGMTLLCLWMGEEGKRKFEQRANKDEYEFAREKNLGKLPYPEDMSDHMLSLIKALTCVDSENRPDFSKIKEWAEGKDPFLSFLDKGKDNQYQFSVLFKGAPKLVAHSPEELANFMQEDPDLAIHYLFDKDCTVAKWLKEGGRPELATRVEHCVVHEYPKAPVACLFAACLCMDPSIPYSDVNGKACRSAKDIANTIVHNFAKYKQNLKDENDDLYVYLRAFGQSMLVNQTINDFQNKAVSDDEALRRLINQLDPLQPYILYKRDGNPFYINNPDDIIHKIHEFRDDQLDVLTEKSFFSWLSVRDQNALGRINQRLSELPVKSKIRIYTVLFNLNPKISYDFCLDPSEGNYIFSLAQLAEYTNLSMDEYIHSPKNSDQQKSAEDMLLEVNYIDDSSLYAYLKSKNGIYDKWIDWLRNCCNINSEDKKKRAAPYNWRIATYKAIKGMGATPYYYFPESKIKVYHPDELRKVPKKEVRKEMEIGALKDWLTVFYQEDPNKQFNKRYDFEKETAKYINKVGELNPDDVDYKNFHTAQNQVLQLSRKLKSLVVQLVSMRVLVALFCFIPIVGLIVMLLINGLPWTENPMPVYSEAAMSVMTVIFGVLVVLFSDSIEGGCITALIVGAIGGYILSLAVYYIVYFALKLLMPIAPYVIIALLLLLAFFIYRSCYREPSLGIKHNKALFNPTLEHTVLEPLDYAYKRSNSPFDSSIYMKSYSYMYDLESGRKKLLIHAIPTSIVTALLLFVFVKYTYGGGFSFLTDKKTPVYEQLTGTWEGTFDNRNAIVTIYEIDENGALTGNVSVKYKNQLNEKITGTVNLETGEVVFDDVVQNSNLDGIYHGVLEMGEEMMTIAGTYVNKRTGKQVEYSFSKPNLQFVENESVPDNDINYINESCE